MSIIKPEIFVDDIFIPQLSQLPVEEAVQGFIDKYEPKVLRKLLGVKMYNDALTASAVDPVAAPWADFFDGADYDSGSKHFDGLKLLIADYVYWFYMFDYNVQTVQVGVAKPKSENATPASPVHKMVSAWNEFVYLTCSMHDYLRANEEDFPDYAHINRTSICSDCHCGCGCGHGPLFAYKNSLGI